MRAFGAPTKDPFLAPRRGEVGPRPHPQPARRAGPCAGAVVRADETGLVRRSGLRRLASHSLVETDLRTGLLVLRGFTGTDLQELAALDVDPQVMYFITGGLPTPPEEVAREVLPTFLT